MGSKKVAQIFGAGMSGLTAAINLAKEGYQVTVHEKEPGYGGSNIYNPSTHVTPIDPLKTSEYIGIDISSAFDKLRACPFYFNETKVHAPVEGFYAVERGSRSTSIDTLLYKECQKLDIDFVFNSPLRKEDVLNIPENSIIACGLTPSVYKMLDLPHLDWFGWVSRGETSISNYAWIWWGDCVSEYGYFSSANNYYFNFLFSIREVGKNCLKKYEEFMIRNEGIEHDQWEYISGVVPLGAANNPRLFWDGKILCGTISGAMDPFLWFGIPGALITGKIAAIAAIDPERAKSEFYRFNRKFKKSYLFKTRIWYPFVRSKVNLIERIINSIGVNKCERNLEQAAEKGRIPVAVPGFGRYSCD